MILGIHGPPGDGKTFQTEQTCDRAGVHLILISGGQLESGTAGEPAEILRSAYRDASVSLTGGQPTALLLNDADAAIGVWNDLTQYTVNTQNVITELMHLADYPTVVEGHQTRRVPILVTGNDFGRLYGPLRRPGRMGLLNWSLTIPEREALMARILDGMHAHEITTLCREFGSHSLAFWATVAIHVQDGALIEMQAEHGLQRALQLVLQEQGPAAPLVAPRLEDVRATASAILVNGTVNHLALSPGEG